VGSSFVGHRPLFVLASLSFGLALAEAGCKPGAGGAGVQSRVDWNDAGGTPTATLVVTDTGAPERRVPLPAGELAPGVTPKVQVDAQSRRLVYPSAAGARVVYLIGAGAYLGPNGSEGLAGAPGLDAALGVVFANAGAQRERLFEDVAREKGDEGVARLLVGAVGEDGKEWEAALEKLAAPRRAQVQKELEGRLLPGAPTVGLGRVVAHVGLSRAPALATRVRELLAPMREPRALAVLVRAVARLDTVAGGSLGCEVLAKNPLDPAATGPAEVVDRPGREALVEAALIAVAHAKLSCPHVAPLLGDDVCVPSLRCGSDGAPLSPSTASKQDEPLCRRAELEAELERELARAPRDVLAITGGTRSSLFAFSALEATGKVPAGLDAAHARRRYTLTQPATPSCDAVPVGTSCHCDEATIRDEACRRPTSTSIAVGICKFDVDDKQKKITNVVAAAPP